MRNFAYLALLVLILAVPLTLVQAQDSSGGLPEDFSMIVIQQAVSGTLQDNGDDTVTLTLTLEEGSFRGVQLTPVLTGGILTPDQLAQSWSAAGDDLVAEHAILITDDLVITLTLHAPTHEDGTLTYIASIQESHPEPDTWPVSLDRPTVVIQMDADFFTSLMAGFDTQAASN